jgi:hypothetical protein
VFITDNRRIPPENVTAPIKVPINETIGRQRWNIPTKDFVAQLAAVHDLNGRNLTWVVVPTNDHIPGALKLSHPHRLNKTFLSPFLICKSGPIQSIEPSMPCLDVISVEQTPVIYVTIDPLPNASTATTSVTDPASHPLEISKKRTSQIEAVDLVAYVQRQVSTRADYSDVSKYKNRRLGNSEVIKYWTFIASVLSEYGGTYQGGKVSSFCFV